MLNATSVAMFFLEGCAAVGQPGCSESDMVGYVEAGGVAFAIDAFYATDRATGKQYLDFRSSNSDDDAYYAGELRLVAEIAGKSIYRGEIYQAGVKFDGTDQALHDHPDDNWKLIIDAEADNHRPDGKPVARSIVGACTPEGIVKEAA